MGQQRFLTLAVLAVLSLGAQAADKVYRCGQTYQQVPCDQGQAFDASDQRTESQRRDARDAAKAEQQQAKDLVAERRQREKAITPQREILRTGAPPAAAAPATSASAAHGHPKKKTGKGKSKPETDDPTYLAPPKPPAR